MSDPVTSATISSCRGLAAWQMELSFNFAIKTEIKVDSAENSKDRKTAINFEAKKHLLAP